MSHRHFCDFAGHYWECDGAAIRLFAGDSEPTACMCLKHGVAMEDSDHSECPVELLACPEHRDEQFKKMSEFGNSLPAESDAEGSGFRDKYGNATVGFCLWCNKDLGSAPTPRTEPGESAEVQRDAALSESATRRGVEVNA